MASQLAIHNLNIRFGAQASESEAVRGISLEIGQGEALGLVGESGSGKSATALAILGLLSPSARARGAIAWNRSVGGAPGSNEAGGNGLGKSGPDARAEAGPSSPIDLLRLRPSELRHIRGREIAMIFQEPMTALNPVMPIGRQVAEALAAHAPNLPRAEIKRRAIAALESVAIPEAARRYSDYPHQFSGGQRQRILIAMALINRPRLLIADEPTTALDVTVQARILRLLRDLQRGNGMAMLFISHDLAVVGQVADRVAVMRKGEIVETGSAAQILTAPTHPYTRSLLAAVPTLATNRNLPLAIV